MATLREFCILFGKWWTSLFARKTSSSPAPDYPREWLLSWSHGQASMMTPALTEADAIQYLQRLIPGAFVVNVDRDWGAIFYNFPPRS